MNPVISHPWNVTPEEAKRIQEKLRGQVCQEPRLGPVHTVAGVDVGFRGDTAIAAVAVLSYPELELVDHALAKLPVTFPYIPGLLAFREGPVVLEALARLRVEPDLLIFDGQGLAHPRRMGIASHIGVLMDKPSIGCAKSRLCGTHTEPGPERGDWVPLYDDWEVIGAVLRTRPGVNPLYISIGHRVDLETAIHYVLACCTRYRLPETTRAAHRLAAGEKPKAVQQPRLF